MKHLYCAKCGQEVLTYPKAVPLLREIIHVVEPHCCSEECAEVPGTENIRPITKEKPSTLELAEIFEDFPFVKKINELRPEEDKTIFDEEELKDRRDEKDIKSSAPTGIGRQLEFMKRSIE